MAPPSWTDRILAPFERKPSSGRYVPEIDGLRFLAIFLVILFHAHLFFRDGTEPVNAHELAGKDWGTIMRHLPNFFIAKGWFGVQIFFVISGLVLAIPFASHHLNGTRLPELRSYFKRRLIRIEIPYLITLTIFFVTSGLWSGAGMREMLPHYLAGLIYSHTFFYDGALNPLLAVAWTLEIEIQFYLLAPFLCRIFMISNAPLRRGILVLGVVASQFLNEGLQGIWESRIWDHSIIGQLGYFLIGILITDFFLSPGFAKWREGSRAHFWDVLGLITWPMVFLMIEWHFPVSLKPFVLLLGFLSVLCGNRLLKLFRNRWLTAVGAMCYTIYLFHNTMLYVILRPTIFKDVQAGNWPLNAILICVMAVMAIVMCAGLFLFVEKPFARGKLPWRSKE
ncbi:acyltransferase [Akkermansiaceae bacterium]|nr:acyltransferase [Akkermansiaceae bacterium]MDB4498800.1 acyltransferase [Akkermansiaceae bacterium]